MYGRRARHALTGWFAQINLRPGGATHPIMTLNLLTDGYYDESTGLYTLDEDSPTYEGLLDDQKK